MITIRFPELIFVR